MKKLVMVLVGIVVVIGITTIVGYNLLMSGEEIKEIEDVLRVQEEIEEYIESYGYSFDNPNVIVNPYGNSPLTALVMFDSDKIEDIKVIVKGKNEEVSYSYIVKGSKNNYVPIYGLYDNYDNTVIIKMGDKEKEIKVKTDNIDDIEIIDNYGERNISFVDKDSYSYAIDKNGDIRWYLEGYGGSLERLDNGNFLLHNGRSIGNGYYTGLVEMDMLGKIYYEYLIGNGGYRGDYTVIDNNIYIISKRYINVISRQSGMVFKSYEIDKDYKYIDNKDGNVIVSDGDSFIKLDIRNGDVEELEKVDSYSNVYDRDMLKEVEYRKDKAIRFNGNIESKVSNLNIWLFNYKSIREEDYNIEMYQEFDRIIINGIFSSDSKVYVILDGLEGKRVYEMDRNGDKFYKYISKINLDGKYTIYFKIGEVLYKSNYYVKV